MKRKTPNLLLSQKTNKFMISKRITQIFLGLMGLAFCKVGVEALLTPETVMANVGITLDNVSALSSIRAVYGGMHFVFGAFCVWGIFKGGNESLKLVALYTAGFVVGRLVGIVIDGAPNSFVLTWLITESISFGIAAVLLNLSRQEIKVEQAIIA
jgi:hypothetical protein